MNGNDIDHHAEMTRVIIIIHLIGIIARGMTDIRSTEIDRLRNHMLPEATDVIDQELHHHEIITGINT